MRMTKTRKTQNNRTRINEDDRNGKAGTKETQKGKERKWEEE